MSNIFSLSTCVGKIIEGKDYRLLGEMSNGVVMFETNDMMIIGSDDNPGFSIDIKSKRRVVGYGVNSVNITKVELFDLDGRICGSSLKFKFKRADGSPFATIHLKKDTISVISHLDDDKYFEWSIDDGDLRFKHRDGGDKGNDVVSISDWPIDEIVTKIYAELAKNISSANLVEEFKKLFDVIKSLLILNIVTVEESWRENIEKNIGVERRYQNDTTLLERDLQIISDDISEHTKRP